MTFNNTAWAIDGALTDASLPRTEAYHNSSTEEGITAKADLKVTALDTPGQGVQISMGAGQVLNRYQTNPNQMYTVANPGVHIVPSSSMPAASPSQQTYVVAVAVGDPEFSQAGHPFMLATDPPAGEEATFEYVRPVVVLESDFNARAYPALALARLTIPADTTVIQNSMITDLRALARPRTWLAISHSPGAAGNNSLNGGGFVAGVYERWPNVAVLTVKVPSWAVKAKISGFVEGARLEKAGIGKLRAYVEGTALSTPVTNVDEYNPNTVRDRRSYVIGGEIDVRDIAGTTKTFSVEGTPNNDASKGFLVAAGGSTSVLLQVYFEEQPT